MSIVLLQQITQDMINEWNNAEENVDASPADFLAEVYNVVLGLGASGTFDLEHGESNTSSNLAIVLWSTGEPSVRRKLGKAALTKVSFEIHGT